MKFIIIGDLHFGASNASENVQRVQKKFIDFLLSYIDTYNITTIIQTGDLFDNRKHVAFTTLKFIRDEFFIPLEARGINLIVIAGNHDILYRNTSDINSVELLCPLWVQVIDKKPTTVCIDNCLVDCYPWINESNRNYSNEFLSNSNGDLSVGHFEFSDFPMYSGSMAKSGDDHTLYNRYQHVYSGHYHTISTKGNVTYVGTPYELTWADLGDPRGFWVVDTDTLTHEFIRSPHTMFTVIHYVDGMRLLDSYDVEDHHVRLYQSDTVNQALFDSFVLEVQAKKPFSLDIINTSIKEAVAEASAVVEYHSTDTMIHSVIDGMALSVDKETLKEKTMQVYREAINLVTKL